MKIRLAVITSLILGSIQLHALNENPNTDWMKCAKYGVLVHYLDTIQNEPTNPLGPEVSTSWDDTVNAFNVDLFAEQMDAAGVGYVIFTLQQGSKYMIAPNETYTQLTGYPTGEACSTRDLVNDLFDALDSYGIKLMLYITGDGPHGDSAASLGLGWTGRANPTFVCKWGDVMKEYSNRYKTKIAGWWVDGCYEVQYGYNDVYINSYWQDLMYGNANGIFAFNKGVTPIGTGDYPANDYTPGERPDLDTNCTTRWVGGHQWHLLTYSGASWAAPHARWTYEYLRDQVRINTSHEGVMTFSIGVYRNGTVDQYQLAQMKSLKAEFKGAQTQTFDVISNGAVTSSSSNLLGFVSSNAIDHGDTIWADDGTNAHPYWQADLGVPSAIRHLEMIPRKDGDGSQVGTRRNFEVRGSNTPDFSSSVVLASCGPDPFALQSNWLTHITNWEAHITDPGLYRYIRVCRPAGSSDSHLNFSEFRIYGSKGVNLVSGTNEKDFDVSSEFGAGYEAKKGADGQGATLWASKADNIDPTPHWQVALPTPFTSGVIEIVARQDGDQPQARRNFEIRASDSADGFPYVVLGGRGDDSDSVLFPHLGSWSVQVNGTDSYKYIRVVRTGSQDHHLNFSEFRVFAATP